MIYTVIMTWITLCAGHGASTSRRTTWRVRTATRCSKPYMVSARVRVDIYGNNDLDYSACGTRSKLYTASVRDEMFNAKLHCTSKMSSITRLLRTYYMEGEDGHPVFETLYGMVCANEDILYSVF